MVKKILVTGANGYIGTILCNKLLRKGFEVIGWDTDYFKDITIGRYKNKYYSKRTDIRDKIKKLNGIDCIIHLAALSNDPMGALNEKLTLDINYKATITLAKKAKKMGVKRFIFSSSCSVYGIAKENLVNENSPINPLTAYAKSKVLVETELKKLRDDNFCVCLLRNATVYGFSPRFRNDLVVNNLVTSAIAFEEIRILSDGSPWRPLVDIQDLSEIISKFITLDSKAINGEIFNVGFDESNYRIKDIVKYVKKYLPSCKIIYTGEHGKDSRSYRVDFSKIKKILPKLIQKWPLEKSIHHLIKKLNQNFTKKDFDDGKFIRLTHLQNLMKVGKLNKDLYWI
ncbi:MAG: SDR family oxidoreductase [Candidatus Daviesbacteria bacterium]|nr:SDR family oxidoreductase [Candidatus Daviesbacteria bacterium]